MQCERLHMGQMRMKKFSVTSACFCSCRRHFSHRLWLHGSMKECRRSRLHMGQVRWLTKWLLAGMDFSSSSWVSLLPMQRVVLELTERANTGVRNTLKNSRRIYEKAPACCLAPWLASILLVNKLSKAFGTCPWYPCHSVCKDD